MVDEDEIFSLDLKNFRKEQQELTNTRTRDALIESNVSDEDLTDLVNFHALDRICNDLEISREEFYDFITEKKTATIAAHAIRIEESRRGTKAEQFLFNEIDKITSKYGINIVSLGPAELRPTKDGKLMDKQEFQDSGKNKDTDCLKSVDGRITGAIDGYIFAKIVHGFEGGTGGHQDNVFRESSEFAEWIKDFGEPDKIYVLLVDTDLHDLFKAIHDKYSSDNLWIVDHVDLQRKLIESVS
ncbi:MAG: hypothetical protein GWP25_00435 [Euryarchaeota archaeon]|nr:hypothetical protein [Euryarchaeota archaeon]